MTKPQAYYWVPEDCAYSNASDCLDARPDDGAAMLVYSQFAYEELKAELDRERKAAAGLVVAALLRRAQQTEGEK
jgi:hypothetical protein